MKGSYLGSRSARLKAHAHRIEAHDCASAARVAQELTGAARPRPWCRVHRAGRLSTVRAFFLWVGGCTRASFSPGPEGPRIFPSLGDPSPASFLRPAHRICRPRIFFPSAPVVAFPIRNRRFPPLRIFFVCGTGPAHRFSLRWADLRIFSATHSFFMTWCPATRIISSSPECCLNP